MFYKVTINIELANDELSSLRKNIGLGSCKSLMTFSPSEMPFLLYRIFANVLLKQASLICFVNLLFPLPFFCTTLSGYFKIIPQPPDLQTCFTYKFNVFHTYGFLKYASLCQEGFNIFLTLDNVTVNVFGFQPHKNAAHYAFINWLSSYKYTGLVTSPWHHHILELLL